MNVIGETSFDMYLHADNIKPLRRPTISNTRQEIVRTNKLRSAAEGRPCYCDGGGDETRRPETTFEDASVTECLISSLNVMNGENILSLVQNYLTQGCAFSEATLQAFLAFLMDTSSENVAAEKYRIWCVLLEHLRLHPGCDESMVARYRALMLAKDEQFAHLTLLEYAVSKLEQLVSVHNDVRISDTRTSRRRKRPARLSDESAETCGRKRRAMASCEKGGADPAEEEAERTLLQRKEAAAQAANTSHLLAVLDWLVEVLRHELGFTLQRRKPVGDSILAQLIFANGDASAACATSALNGSFLARIYEVLRHSDSPSVIRSTCRLLELVCHVCVMAQAPACASRKGIELDAAELNPVCLMLVNELSDTLLSGRPSPTHTFAVVTALQPVWLRYHVIHPLTEKLFSRRIPFGLEGVATLLNSIVKGSKRERTLDTNNVLKLVNDNQITNAGVGGADVKMCVKSEFDRNATAHFAAATLSKNDEITARTEDPEESEDTCIDFNVRQKLSSYLCKILILFVDSTIKLIKLTNTNDCVSKLHFSKIKNTLNELCGERNIPIEFNMLRRQLNKLVDL